MRETQFHNSRTSALTVGSQSGRVTKRRITLGHSPLSASEDKLLQSAKKASTPSLCLAAWVGNKDLVEAILRSGTYPDVISPEGYTPLCLAAVNGRAVIAKLLIASGANISHPTPAGSNPLRLATRKGHIEVVKILVSAGANVDDVDRQGVPLISLAILHGRHEIARLLLRAGARLNPASDQSQTQYFTSRGEPVSWVPPLCVAASKGCAEIVSSLLHGNADPNIKSAGFSPLHLASRGGHLRIVELLIEAGANVNCLTPQNRCSLSAALEGEHKTVAMYLISKDADCGLLASSTAADLMRLNQWQAEALVHTRKEKEKLVNGIGHMLTAAVAHFRS